MDIINLHDIGLQLRYLKINVCPSSLAWGHAPATSWPQDPDPYGNDPWARGELWLALISSELVDWGSKTLVCALVLLCPSVRNWILPSHFFTSRIWKEFHSQTRMVLMLFPKHLCQRIVFFSLLTFGFVFLLIFSVQLQSQRCVDYQVITLHIPNSQWNL